MLTDPEQNCIKAPNLCKNTKKLAVTPRTPQQAGGGGGCAGKYGVYYQTTWHQDLSKVDPHHWVTRVVHPPSLWFMPMVNVRQSFPPFSRPPPPPFPPNFPPFFHFQYFSMELYLKVHQNSRWDCLSNCLLIVPG